ncbi:T9SS type A sorting domain-containing protein [bacterium]|nr:T9SS type A sorting domain-containing protein [bacterium]
MARTRDFTLTGNYPNPFNASTTISYTLMRKSRIEVAVFNTLGQKIAVLSEGIEQAGNHTVRWDAGQLPSGMYICMIRANGLSGTRKMTLVK